MALLEQFSVASSSVTVFTQRDALRAAISEYLADAASANAKHGDINLWDVSQVTDFSSLFEGAETFNADISNWDLSAATSMKKMFQRASLFDQDIGEC